MAEARSLRDLARELNAELADAHPDDGERAAEVANALRLHRPETTARGRQRAAAAATGSEAPPTRREGETLLDEPGPARRAGRQAHKRGGRVARRAVATARGSSGGALVTQALGLAALYWVLRFPDAVTRGLDGARRVLDWIVSPVPIGVSLVGVGNPSTGTDGTPLPPDTRGGVMLS